MSVRKTRPMVERVPFFRLRPLQKLPQKAMWILHHPLKYIILYILDLVLRVVDESARVLWTFVVFVFIFPVSAAAIAALCAVVALSGISIWGWKNKKTYFFWTCLPNIPPHVFGNRWKRGCTFADSRDFCRPFPDGGSMKSFFLCLPVY